MGGALDLHGLSTYLGDKRQLEVILHSLRHWYFSFDSALLFALLAAIMAAPAMPAMPPPDMSKVDPGLQPTLIALLYLFPGLALAVLIVRFWRKWKDHLLGGGERC